MLTTPTVAVKGGRTRADDADVLFKILIWAVVRGHRTRLALEVACRGRLAVRDAVAKHAVLIRGNFVEDGANVMEGKGEADVSIGGKVAIERSRGLGIMPVPDVPIGLKA